MKTQHRFDPRVEPSERIIDPGLAELFDGGRGWEARVLAMIADEFDGSIVDLRTPEATADRCPACLAAMDDGVEVIVGGHLPLDVTSHRGGCPQLWVKTGASGGRSRYAPVLVKHHRVQEKKRSGRGNEWFVECSPLSDPRPQGAVRKPDVNYRVQRDGALLQVAHFWRLLEAAGYAGAEPIGGIIGTDPVGVDGQPMVTWVDLTVPCLRTYSRSEDSGWTKRSVLERYDHEHSFRVQVAEAALTQGTDEPEPLRVAPIVIDECRRCQFWEACRQQLDDDDISLRIDKAPLDIREIGALRALGIHTITDLAGVDIGDLLARYLPEVGHRRDGESRIRHAHRKADMLVRGVTLERCTSGPVDVPRAEIEIDFDIETSSADRVYLWGFWVRDGAGGGHYRHFACWHDMDDDTEIALAREAMGWLRSIVESGRSVKVYHYSDYETVRLGKLAASSGDATLNWVLERIPDMFCDLYAIVRRHWFGTAGLGLKVVASEGTGFAWRDDNPGGLNSLAWFDEAAHAEDGTTRAAAQRRILEYNEDDVRATVAVREWIWATTEAAEPQ